MGNIGIEGYSIAGSEGLDDIGDSAIGQQFSGSKAASSHVCLRIRKRGVSIGSGVSRISSRRLGAFDGLAAEVIVRIERLESSSGAFYFVRGGGLVKAEEACVVIINKLFPAAVVREGELLWVESVEKLRFALFSIIGVKGRKWSEG